MNNEKQRHQAASITVQNPCEIVNGAIISGRAKNERFGSGHVDPNSTQASFVSSYLRYNSTVYHSASFYLLYVWNRLEIVSYARNRMKI